MDKSIRGLLILLAVGLMLVGVASANVPSSAQVNQAQNLGRYVAGIANNSNVSLTSGNITNINISTSMSTFRWAGLFGNASGQLRLADTYGTNMFVWTGNANMVYACKTTNPSWANLVDANAADVEGAFTFLANNTNASDSYARTFTAAAHPINSNIYPALQSDYATTLSSVSTPWWTYSLKDNVPNIVFAGKTVLSGTAYNGDNVNFQMIIPEDGTGGDETSTAWNLFVELV